MNLLDAETIIFDCDGVILQSNKLKSDAFAGALPGYDADLVNEFVDWHKARGGVSRFAKFEHFFKNMIQVDDWDAQTKLACDRFGDIVFKGLLACPHITGFEALLERLSSEGIPLAVNPGGAEAEITKVFQERGLLPKFEAILGSPTKKIENMQKLADRGLLTEKSVYFGDSALDYELAKAFSLSFVYVSMESEWAEGASVAAEPTCFAVTDHLDLVNSQYILI